MANPQKENGYTAISNELLEKLYYTPLNGSEFRICLMVIRKTYGFKKKEDRISLSQFTKGIGLKRPNICRTIKSLVANRLLLKTNKGFKFNKNYDDWVVAKRLPSSQNDNSGSSQNDNRVVANRLHTKEIITKEIKTKGELEKLRKQLKDKKVIKR